MIVDLTGFLDSGEITYPLEGEINAPDTKLFGDGIELINPIEYKGMIYKVTSYYTLDLKINYSIKTECDRCLKPIEKALETRLSGKLTNNHNQVELEDEDVEEPIYLDNNKLELKSYILEEVVSSIPLKTICDENCKGLCQSCGVDLNKESCDCDDNIIDPRFEKLKDFFPDQ